MADDSSSDQVVDQRHLKRVKLMQALFAYTFNDADNAEEVIADQDLLPLVKRIVSQLDKIDELLQQQASERPIADINQVDLAVLRLILYEFLYKKTPRKVLIDEAVELAKEYGSDSSPRFVNGVLGKLLIEKDINRA